MNRMMKLAIGGGALAAAVFVSGAVSLAASANGSGSDDAEAPITGSALEQASTAALAHTGEGVVTDTEVGDEESYYEVEVTLDNGNEVDVQLDEKFRVVLSAPEGSTED